ncbi:hypothetical protein AMAG_05304 [Allomyces macrogynus ATCC 38327]|uniref:Uncharacterized protein n=1 Tax=Allomyces macrogynus (strain ATCC 38327) TaxID=578462 RepID=A0A0L0SBJ5_ALLM3|nr:hypothetical protein AMAG_05304 [Allomyces macrogynus ATCC 38327]|eukprot:KNE59851.1 hypothetical protein AMAG_05304 [Allomyces macrogynus ATCC 38327]
MIVTLPNTRTTPAVAANDVKHASLGYLQAEAVSAATDATGSTQTLPWNYDLTVLGGLIFFLLVAIAQWAWNAYTLHRTLAVRSHDKQSAATRTAAPVQQTPGTATNRLTDRISRQHRETWWTKSRLAKLQLFAATMHVANQIMFLVQHAGRHLDCVAVVIFSAILYTLLVVPASAVLILQSTMLVPAYRRMFKRTALFLLVAVAMGLIMGSVGLLSWNLDQQAATGVCSMQYDRTLNVSGKAIFVTMYLIILFVLVRPMVRHVLAMRKMHTPGMQRDEHSRRLETAVLMLLFKITTASILGIFNVFGRFFALEFSLENCAAIYASTLALERLRPASTGSSDDPSASATGNGGERVGDSRWSWSSTDSPARELESDAPPVPLERNDAVSPVPLHLCIDLTESEAAVAVAKLIGTPADPHAKARSPAPSSSSPTHLPSMTNSTTSFVVAAAATTPGGQVADNHQVPRPHVGAANGLGLGRWAASGMRDAGPGTPGSAGSRWASDKIPLQPRPSFHHDPVSAASLARTDVWVTAPEFAVDPAMHHRHPVDGASGFDDEMDDDDDVAEAQRLRRAAGAAELACAAL